LVGAIREFLGFSRKEFFRLKQIVGELMHGNHNVPFRNSSASLALLSVLPLQLKLRQKGKS